ncbi:MAG: hypothetical protein LC808_14625 [Actinobacteria bacterium]|nr:hypothetical protein [Actinomycetota bacterium]
MPPCDVADIYRRDFTRAGKYMAATTSSGLTVLEKFLAVLTALLTLGSAFMAYKTTTLNQAKQQAQEVAVYTNNNLSLLQREYDSLRAENARLRTQLGLPGPTADPRAPSAAKVRHSGPLVLAAGYSADLDSPSSDPQWTTNTSDISFSGDTISPYPAGLYLGDKKADYETCRNTTGYSNSSLDVGSVSVGTYFCVKTESGRYSALRITQLDSSKVGFDIVTYDPPK